MAPGVGLEPTISTLTAWRCTSQLPRNKEKTAHERVVCNLPDITNCRSGEWIIVIIIGNLIDHEVTLTTER